MGTSVGVESLTYPELAGRLGTSREAARSLVRRLRLPKVINPKNLVLVQRAQAGSQAIRPVVQALGWCAARMGPMSDWKNGRSPLWRGSAHPQILAPRSDLASSRASHSN